MQATPVTSKKNLDAWLEKVQKAQYLAEEELKSLCDTVKEILVEESNVQPVNTPVTVRRPCIMRFGVQWIACMSVGPCRQSREWLASVCQAGLPGPPLPLPCSFQGCCRAPASRTHFHRLPPLRRSAVTSMASCTTC